MPIEDILHPYLAAYTKAPQWLKSTLGGAYALVPQRVRYGAQYTHFLQEALLTDPDEIAHRASEKLRATLSWAAQTVPAYAAMRDVVRSSDTAEQWLAQFPLLTKATLKANEQAYLSTAMPASRRLLTHTGGSTSVPMRLYLEKYVSRSKDFAYTCMFDRVAGIARNDVILALRGRTVPGADRPDGPIWMFDPIKSYLHLSSDHLEPGHMPRYVEAMRRWKPTFIHAFPSALYPIARWLKAHPDEEITSRIRAIQLFSENIYPFQVELMREVFDCPVLLDYGHSERALKAISYLDDSRYFFWPLYGKIELIGLDGRPVTTPGALGEIVATGFDNRVMPLVRYRTGDLATLGVTGSGTRAASFVVDRIEGRVQEFLVCHDRRLVSITTIGAAHFHELAAAERMQFVQERPGHATLKVETHTPLSDAARAALAHGIHEKTQGGLSVQIIETPSIARTVSGKEKLLIQHLDISSFLGAAYTPVPQ